jgi:hypothetical protein
MSMQHTAIKRVSERLDAWEVRGESESGYAIEITDVSKRRVPAPYARACILAVERCRELGLHHYLVEHFTWRVPSEFLLETVQIETGTVIETQIVNYR